MRVCVFCGASAGRGAIFRETASEVARALVLRGAGIVYGGGSVGCMGALADAALALGGEVIGVIPEALAAREVAHRGLTELHVVGSMHERKALMAQEADAFVALPGGFGTLDEFFEILTWAQLGIHTKPCLMVNTDGYYDHLLSFLEVAIEEGFLKGENRAYIQVVGNAAEALQRVQKLWESLAVCHVAPGEPAP